MRLAWLLLALPLGLPYSCFAQSPEAVFEIESENRNVTAITLQVLENSQSVSFAGGLKDVIVHFACFQPLEFNSNSNTNATLDSNADAKSGCCKQLRYSVNYLCDHPESSTFSSSLPSSLCMQLQKNEMLQGQAQCEHMAAPMPKLSNNIHDGGIISLDKFQVILEPSVYFTLRAKISFEKKRIVGRGKANAFSLVQYNNHKGGIWSKYLDPYSPLEIEKGNEGQDVPAVCKENDNPISVVMESSLSEKGGMHRAFKHTIALQTTADHVSKKFNGTIHGEVNVILPQSQDIFLDMDDPFQKGERGACSMVIGNRPISVQKTVLTGNCNVSLVSVPHLVIDIEQPAFVSPQHVVALKIEFEGYVPNGFKLLGNKGGYIEIALAVTTNLHFRYPLTSGNDDSNNLVPVHVPTPFLYDAKLIGTDGILSVQSVQNCHKTSKGVAFKSGIGVSGSWEKGIMEIAAGHDKHYGYVMIITVLVSLIGAWRILFDMSKVSSWKTNEQENQSLEEAAARRKAEAREKKRTEAQYKAKLRADLEERLEESLRKQEVARFKAEVNCIAATKATNKNNGPIANISEEPPEQALFSSSIGQEVNKMAMSDSDQDEEVLDSSY